MYIIVQNFVFELWPTWWPQSCALSAPAPQASQTDRETVLPQPEMKHGSGPVKGVVRGWPTHTACCGGRSQGGLGNWKCLLSQSKLPHNLRNRNVQALRLSKDFYQLQSYEVNGLFGWNLLRVSDGGILAGCGVAVLSSGLLAEIVGGVWDTPSTSLSRSGGWVGKNWPSTAWPFISKPRV